MRIIHTSDTHNKLTKEKADFLKSLNADYYFDSGDIIKSGNIDFNIFGEKAWDIYNSVHYDAICPGNREYHFSKFGFWCKNRGFNMPLVTCNYIYKYKNPITTDFITFNRTNEEICVLGISNINIDKSMACHKISSQYQENIFESLENSLGAIKNNFIILLSHIGLENDIKIAKLYPQIKLILGGHSHDFGVNKINNTTIVHSGAYAKHYSEIIIDKEIKVNQKDF